MDHYGVRDVNVVELFSCAGGMAEGLRRAGLPVSMAFDFDSDACDSYEANLGHRPIQIDARDLLRRVQQGVSLGPIDLFVADPPCTPWSRAGKRLGQSDERDMLAVTCELVELLRPRFFLIANVPGLDDGPNWPIVQRTIGALSKSRYCIDFARIDAADVGVAQHRVRPFWVGHPFGSPCIQWPQRTHGPVETNGTLPGVTALRPWATCRQALGHLSGKDLGSPVRLRWRGANGNQIASIPDAPARVVGTSNLSDGNVLAHPTDAIRKDNRKSREPGRKARASHFDEPAGVVTCKDHGGDGNIIFDGPNHRPSRGDAPARTLTRNTHGGGALLVASSDMFSPSVADEPSKTVRAAARGQQILVNDKHPPSSLDSPSPTLGARDGRHGPSVLQVEVPHHPPSEIDEPSRTVRASSSGTSDKIVRDWPWDAPAAVVTADRRGRIGPPGHHGKSFLSAPNAVKLSEKAAAILQGFPEDWRFCGETKRARWGMIGQAMPPPLAEAVGRSILSSMRRTEVV